MLTMVIANPIQLTTVSEVPLDSTGAFCATNVENKGESAMTTNPQKNKKTKKTELEDWLKNTGDKRQHNPDKLNAPSASF